MTKSRFFLIGAAALAIGLSSPALATSASQGDSAPAASSGGTPIPEPSDFALFVLGVTGLIIGRRTARTRARHRDTNLDA